MKPKTIIQKRIVEVNGQVSPLTPEQKKWAEEQCFGNHYVNVRNRNNCLQCGHKWKPSASYYKISLRIFTCPKCGAKSMKHIDHWNTDESIYEYYAKIEVVEEFQVVRMFRVQKYMKRKQPVEFRHVEAMRHYISEDGKFESMQRLGQGMGSIYVDSWVFGSHLELRTKSPSFWRRVAIRPYKIIKGRETLSIIRRNGYNGGLYGQAPHELFLAILNHQKAETLLKAGQKSLFKKYVGLHEDKHEKIDRYWDSICIAMRNDYIIKDAGDYLDYLSMLEEFEKDLHNPHYICPDDFHEAHQRYVEKRVVKRNKEDMERQKERIAEAQEEYLKAKQKYFDLKIVSGEIQIIPMKSVQDVIELGNRLHHCLDIRYAEKEHSLILGAYLGDQPLEAIEINLKRMDISQSRGLQNEPTKYHNLIVEAVQKNMNKIAKKAKYKEVA